MVASAQPIRGDQPRLAAFILPTDCQSAKLSESGARKSRSRRRLESMQLSENLEAAVALHMAYCNFCCQTRKPGKISQKRGTAGMVAHMVV